MALQSHYITHTKKKRYSATMFSLPTVLHLFGTMSSLWGLFVCGDTLLVVTALTQCLFSISHPQQGPTGHSSSAGFHGEVLPAWPGAAPKCQCGSHQRWGMFPHPHTCEVCCYRVSPQSPRCPTMNEPWMNIPLHHERCVSMFTCTFTFSL